MALPVIDVRKTLRTLAAIEETITSHRNSEPPSVGKTVTSFLVDPTNLAGDVQAVWIATAFFQTPGEHLITFPGLARPVRSGSVVAIGAVRLTTTDCASTSLIPLRISFS